MQRIADFFATLMQGGTLEIILLIVLIIVGLILLLVALWLAWKLLGLLGKGLQWVFQRGGEAAQARSIAKREEELSRPPLVATGWGSTGRLGLRVALAEASRLATPQALRIVVVAGEQGFADLCRSLGLAPPGAGRIGITAGMDTVLIDASRASAGELRRLGRALPWRRPLDGIAVLVGSEGLPGDGISRAASLARATGVKSALHFVLPSANAVPAWRNIETSGASGDVVCSQLAADAVRIWLVGGDRQGFEELARSQTRDLPAALDRAMAVAPSAHLDVASLSFSGAGLHGAAAQAVGRTRPTTTPGIVANAAYAAFGIGVVLSIVAAFWIVDESDRLRGTLSTAGREAAIPWTAEGVDAVPHGARVQRLAGVGARLSEYSEFPLLSPLAPFIPNWSAPVRLGSAFLSGYVLSPLGSALERDAALMLAPHGNAERWLNDARLVSEWIAAWEGLEDDPTEVDLQSLFADAFGDGRQTWPNNVDVALQALDVSPPSPEEGGLDVAGLTDLARANFVLTMQHWATDQYTNGPVATAARQVVAGGTAWREQHAALVNLRNVLQHPGQQWITAADDRSDHAVELRLLGRGLAMGLVGQIATVEAKAEVARIRIDARDRAPHFMMPELGAVLERTGTGSGPSLRMTAAASAWLLFLDKIANAGFSEPPEAGRPVLPGLVTVDRTSVAEARERLRVFDRFAANLSADIPPGPAQRLLLELGAELVVGIAADVEAALRRESNIGVAMVRAERRAEAAAAFQELDEIETWLRDRQALSEADRVSRVRARVANGILTAAAEVLDEEDPLAVYVDPTADGDALVRRFERGLQHTQRIREQFVAPFLATVSRNLGGWAALHWRSMSQDLEAYARGDTDSTLTALEGSVRAYAEDPDNACEAPRILQGRGDYLARVAYRFRAEVDAACESARQMRLDATFGVVANYYDEHISPFSPHAPDPHAADVGVPELGEFVRLLHEHAAVFSEIDDPLAQLFEQSVNFWAAPEEASAEVRFEVEWRWNPGDEYLAQHLGEVRLEGVEVDEAGVHTWRYGTPFRIHLRLAQNSAYRFLHPDGRLTETKVHSSEGHGSFLRVLSDLSNGAVIIRATVAVDGGDEFVASHAAQELRLSARFTHPDGRRVAMPNFPAKPRPTDAGR